MKLKYTIIDGPSKSDFLARFGMKIDGHRIKQEFKITQDGVNTFSFIHLVVNTVSWGDGSGESWIFEGYVTRFVWLESKYAKHQHVHGKFRTDRTGFGGLEVETDEWIPAVT